MIDTSEFLNLQPRIYNSRSRILHKVKLKENETTKSTVVVNAVKSRGAVLQSKEKTVKLDNKVRISQLFFTFKVELFTHAKYLYIVCKKGHTCTTSQVI
jgi:hypothetical protein